jgi:predicted Zn finger-like uncharacterized protein
MILTCPSCSARYLLASDSVGGKGRSVRCGKCGTEWFQEPEQNVLSVEPQGVPAAPPSATEEEKVALDDLISRALEDTVDIDFSSAPSKKGESSKPKPPKEKKDWGKLVVPIRAFLQQIKQKIPTPSPAAIVDTSPSSLQLKIAGGMVALALFSVLLYGAISVRNSVFTGNESPQILAVEGEEGPIAFDRVEAWQDGKKGIKISGNLINLGERMFSLEGLSVQLLDKDGKILTEHPADLQNGILEGEGMIPLAIEIPAGEEGDEPTETVKIVLLSAKEVPPAPEENPIPAPH